MGAPDADIAMVIGISPPTLRKYFPDELTRGRIDANARVAESLYRAATRKDKPNITACIFWLKARAGWREADKIEIGKKQMLEEAARDAEAGTAWDGLLQ